MKRWEIRELFIHDLYPGLLQNFNRYQEVKRCWRKENGAWVLKDIPFIEQWDDAMKEEIIAVDFTSCLNSGGFLWGAFNDNKALIAFASLLSKPFGLEKQYLQLMQLHTSFEYRNKGIGKALFQLCQEKAKQLGAGKLYISAHSSEETQLFYQKIGCVDAVEVNQQLAEHEPCDRQMEFVL